MAIIKPDKDLDGDFGVNDGEDVNEDQYEDVYEDDGEEIEDGANITNGLEPYGHGGGTYHDRVLAFVHAQHAENVAGRGCGNLTGGVEQSLAYGGKPNEANPFAHLAGPSQSGGRAALGMQAADTGSHQYFEQANNANDAMTRQSFSKETTNVPVAGGAHLGGQAGTLTEQQNWYVVTGDNELKIADFSRMPSTGNVHDNAFGYESYGYGQQNNSYVLMGNWKPGIAHLF